MATPAKEKRKKKGKRKKKRSKSSKNSAATTTATEEQTSETAPPSAQGEQNVSKEPVAKQETKMIDPRNDAPSPHNPEERAKKIQRNRDAIENIINKLQSIPADNISQETKEDLMQIHAILRTIVLRYVVVRVDEEKAKLAAIRKEMEKKEQERKERELQQEMQARAVGLKVGDDVMPAFADIQWATAIERDPAPPQPEPKSKTTKNTAPPKSNAPK